MTAGDEMSPEEALAAAVIEVEPKAMLGSAASIRAGKLLAALTVEGYTIVRSDELARLRGIETAARAVMTRYSEQGHCDDSASWTDFAALEAALETRP